MSALPRYLLLVGLASCAVDERTLNYGQGVGSPPVHPQAGSGSNDPEAGSGGDSDANEGGSPQQDTGGTPPEGGSSSGSGGDRAGSAGASGASGGAQGSGGASGANAQGGHPMGGSAGGGAGSGGGDATEIDRDAGACGDIDRNGVQDCEETLVGNAAFDQSDAGWLAEPGLTQAWTAEDARGRAGSGSLTITNTKAGDSGDTWSSSGTGQCLTARSGQVYELGARARVPAGQAEGYARFNLVIYGNDGCQGTVLASVTPALLAETGAWRVINGKVKLPPATRSIYVRLTSEKPVRHASFEVHFDDVLVRKH